MTNVTHMNQLICEESFIHPELKILIDEVLSEVNYQKNPYFTELLSGTFEKEDFVETQIQFYHAVVYFSRPMIALVAKMNQSEQRLEILRNVWEEHGEGDLATKSHGETFLEFLKRLDLKTESDVKAREFWPEVRIFNTTLMGTSVLSDNLVAISCLGIIEKMFSDISRIIGSGVVQNGWITEQNLIHYKLHIDLDIKHSEDFFKLLNEAFMVTGNTQHPKRKGDFLKRELVKEGLWMGATLFNGLYLNLFEKRKRRILK
jgi:hypothetical protein